MTAKISTRPGTAPLCSPMSTMPCPFERRLVPCSQSFACSSGSPCIRPPTPDGLAAKNWMACWSRQQPATVSGERRQRSHLQNSLFRRRPSRRCNCCRARTVAVLTIVKSIYVPTQTSSEDTAKEYCDGCLERGLQRGVDILRIGNRSTVISTRHEPPAFGQRLLYHVKKP